MAPSHLQGLNLLHPQQQESHNPNDLLAGASTAFPDLAAQLELWTNLAFDSEDGGPSPPSAHNKNKNSEDEEEEDIARTRSPEEARQAAILAGHANVVTGTPIPSLPSTHQQHNQSQLDLNALLAGFMGPGGFPQFPQQQQQHDQNQPTLSQLLALGPPPAPLQNTAPSNVSEERPAKRARVNSSRKNSISTPSTPSSPIDEGPNAAEDKRRRNTAASARFRLKKKEREAALEGRAKELETKVSELEKECEGLRRENGWLKGLVVGVTGAAAQGQQPTTASRH